MTRTRTHVPTEPIRAPAYASALLILCALSCAYALSGCTARSVQTSRAEPRWVPALDDCFDRTETLTETTTPDRSASDTWWLDSGAYFIVNDGASTLQGDAQEGYLRTRYAERNARDSDNGLHPQNLFRLLTCMTWEGTTSQRCSFLVEHYNESASPQRGAANGILLFNRYADSANLYYAGIRVDGHAVVKKKSKGIYYTLAETPVLEGRFNKADVPTLLPSRRWLTLRSVAEDRNDGSVAISLYVDDGAGAGERLVLSGVDAGVGGPVIRGGRMGVRTDFMDVRFRDYSLSVAQ